MNDGTDLNNQLRHFTGGDSIYHHGLVKSFNYTEGVRFFAQNAGYGAYWLLDILATEAVITQHLNARGFALVLLKVTGQTAVLTVANDSDAPALYTRNFTFTDCPEAPVTERNANGVWEFYLETTYVGEDRKVILCMLPQER